MPRPRPESVYPQRLDWSHCLRWHYPARGRTWCYTASFKSTLSVPISNRMGQIKDLTAVASRLVSSRVVRPIVWRVTRFRSQNWHQINMSPVLTIAGMGQWQEARCVAGRYAAGARLCCPWALPLGCRSHCHSNYCHADSSCTSLKLIASHSIHFTNMCGNYDFARVIKWESIRNERGETANIPGISAPTLIMTENRLAKFGEIVSRPSHLKRGDSLDWCWQLWTFQTNMLIQMNQQ